MGKKIPNIEARYRTASEALIGRLMVLYQQRPEAAVQFLERVLNISTLTQGDKEVRKTYSIDLKIDFDDPARHKIALHMVRKVARQLLTQVTLIADNRQPQVGITCDDFFEGGSKEGLQDLPDVPEEAGDGVVDGDET